MEKKCSYAKDKWVEPPTYRLLNVPIVQAGWGCWPIVPSLNKPTTVLGWRENVIHPPPNVLEKTAWSSALCPQGVKRSHEESFCWFIDSKGRVNFHLGPLALLGKANVSKPRQTGFRNVGLDERLWVVAISPSCLPLISYAFSRKTQHIPLPTR